MVEEAILIKKYTNRKLYDLSRSRYITLEEVAALIKEGKQVKVVDATSNEDLTNVTLAQIILEEEKRKNLLPVSFLHQLIKYGESLQSIFQKQLASSLEALVSTQMEAGKKLAEWTTGGWAKGWRTTFPQDSPPGSEAKRVKEEDASLLKAELEALKEKLQALEKKLEEK